MDFRVFLVVAIEVVLKTMVEMVENGRKWQIMGCRGYLVGNGFPRVLRHSPTTIGEYRNDVYLKMLQYLCRDCLDWADSLIQILHPTQQSYKN